MQDEAFPQYTVIVDHSVQAVRQILQSRSGCSFPHKYSFLCNDRVYSQSGHNSLLGIEQFINSAYSGYSGLSCSVVTAAAAS